MPIMPTKFYKAPSAEEQESFYDNLYIRHRNHEPNDQITTFLDPEQYNHDRPAFYHVLDTTVVVNREFDKKITITGRTDEKIDLARLVIEHITEISLREIDIRAGEQ